MPSKFGKDVDRFYRSTRWKKARELVIASAGGCCKMCGKFVGDHGHVHHIEPVTDENWMLPIAVDPSNLMLLCEQCHDAIRFQDTKKPVKVSFDENGEVNLFGREIKGGGNERQKTETGGNDRCEKEQTEC